MKHTKNTKLSFNKMKIKLKISLKTEVDLKSNIFPSFYPINVNISNETDRLGTI